MIDEFRAFVQESHGLIVSGPMPFLTTQLDKWRQAALSEMMKFARYEERDGRQCLVRSLDFERWQAVAVCLARLQLNRRTNLSDPFTDQERANEVQKLLALIPSESPPTDMETITGQLSIAQGAVLRYLANKPRGVSFDELQDARDPHTLRKLTESANVDSIKAMLNKLSGKLADHGYQIKVSISRNSIKLERYD